MRWLLGPVLALSLFYEKEGESLESGKVVLITGASKGIGLSTAEFLADEGYPVYAAARSCRPEMSKGNLHFKEMDVTDDASISKTVSEIIEAEGHLDVLINNAGYALGGPVESLLLKETQTLMDVNFFGVIRVCQEVLPYMRAQKSGRIINVSSIQGVYGLPFGSLYTASKSALESLSEALSIEVLPWNIFVSIVEPGFVATEFSVKLGSREVKGNPYRKIQEKIKDSLEIPRTPSESCQTPEEVALSLRQVIEDPIPLLRYQTSNLAREVVSKSIVDVTGEKYLERMKAEVVESYQEAWVDD